MKPGVICVITRKSDGVVLGVGADFDADRPGGFSLEQAQNRRARERAKSDFVRKQCSGLISDGLDSYQVGQIVDALIGRDKIVIQTEAVGGEG